VESTGAERPTDLRVLALSTDPDLARPSDQAVGDALQRQRKYASLLREYHVVVRSVGGPRRPSRPAPGLTIHPTASRSRLHFLPDAYRLGVQIGKYAPLDLVSTEDPMLVGLPGLLLSRRLGIPLSVQLAGDMLDNPYWLADRPINPLLNALGKLIVRAADSVRVVSSSERDKLVRLGVPAERIANLGWMADFASFVGVDGSRRRHELLPPPYSRLVLFVGRLVKQKDLPTLLHTAARVARARTDVRFALAGAGDELPTVLRLRAALGLDDTVVLLGAVPHAALDEYYAACDAFFLPSRYEGNARVLAEAAAAGKPAVTTEVSGARDTVLDGETGFVVPVGQPDLMAERLLELLEDPARAERIGARARAHVLDLYSDKRILAGFREFWTRTAARRRGGRQLTSLSGR
jgi:glycosyltransferase involved in cell wall biosynthesis